MWVFIKYRYILIHTGQAKGKPTSGKVRKMKRTPKKITMAYIGGNNATGATTVFTERTVYDHEVYGWVIQLDGLLYKVDDMEKNSYSSWTYRTPFRSEAVARKNWNGEWLPL